MEAMIKVKVGFPEKESGLDLVTLTGPEPQVQAAGHKLQDLIPDVQSLHIPSTPNSHHAIRSPEFHDVQFRIHQEFGVELYVYSPTPDPSATDECAFWFYVKRGCGGGGIVDGAKKVVLEYLLSKQVPLQVPLGGVQRSGSYANLTPQRSYDSFQHFNSKLLATVTTGAESAGPTMASNYSLFQDTGMFDLGRSTKLAQSVPNLRQLFEDAKLPPSSTPTASTTEMKRSRSVRDGSADPSTTSSRQTSILGATLAATAVGSPGMGFGRVNEGWGVVGSGPFQRSGSTDALFATHHSPYLPPPGMHLPHHQMSMHQQVLHRHGMHPDDEDMTSPTDADALLTGLGSALSPGDDEDGGARAANDGGISGQFAGMNLKAGDDKASCLLKTRTGKSFGPRAPTSGLATADVISDSEEAVEAPSLPDDVIEDLFRMEAQKPKDPQQIRLLLDTLELSKHAQTFIDQEIDFPLLLTLSDSDLKELGVNTFGSRKKIVNAVKECKASRPYRAMVGEERGRRGSTSGGNGGRGGAGAAAYVGHQQQPSHQQHQHQSSQHQQQQQHFVTHQHGGSQLGLGG
ncbi:hypothetical protein HK104_000931 [Borealophlyctis nickersoniae]|nr:hypothetical protein HK104_000931 [Borealophlyctis nickersoniae]